MPRGIKRETNISDEVAVIDAKIQRHEKNIAELKGLRSKLLEQQRRFDTDRLLKAVSENGLSIDEAITMLAAN